MSNNPDPTSGSDKPAAAETPPAPASTPASDSSTTNPANPATTTAAPNTATPAPATGNGAPASAAPTGAPPGMPAGGPPGGPPQGGRPPQVFSDEPLNDTTVPRTDNLYVFGDPKNDRDRLIAQSFAFAQYIRLNTKRFIRSEPSRILDIGCGDGQLSLVLNRVYPKAQIVGIDKDPQAIETANRLQERAAGITGRIDYRAMDAEQDLPEGPFDLIYISMMLLHTRNPRKVLEMAYDRLAPGGFIWIRELVTDFATAVTNPNWERLAGLVVSTMTKAGFHPVIGNDLKGMLTSIGFADVKVESEIFRPNDGTPTGQIIISLGLSVFYNAMKFISMINQIPESELLRIHNDLSKDALKLKGRLNFPNVIGRKPLNAHAAVPAEGAQPQAPEGKPNVPTGAAPAMPAGAPPGAPAGGQPGGPPQGGRPEQVFSDEPLNPDTKIDTENLYIFTDTKNDRDRLIAQAHLFGNFLTINAKRFLKTEPKSILDFGCGDGQLSLVLKRVFPKARVVGVDFDPKAIETAQKLLQRAAGISGTIEYVVGDDSNLPEGQFDLVYVSMVVVHFRNPAQAIKNLAEKVAPGGVLWVKDINTRSFMEDVKGDENWQFIGGKMLEAMAKIGANPHVAETVAKMMEEAGLINVRTEKEIYRYGDPTANSQIALSIGLGALMNAMPMISRILQVPMSELRARHEEMSKNAMKIKGNPHYINMLGQKAKGTTPLQHEKPQTKPLDKPGS